MIGNELALLCIAVHY